MGKHTTHLPESGFDVGLETFEMFSVGMCKKEVLGKGGEGEKERVNKRANFKSFL
jgi:hypothetical protein